MNRRFAVFFALAGALAPAALLAQSVFPSKPIRIVVTLPPGASADAMARAVGTGLTAAWGQPVLVDHRPGANGILAVNQLLQAPPDGYTLLLSGPSTYTVNPFVYDKLPYDPARDLAPVTMIGSLPVIIAVSPSVQAKSIRELIALAKSQPGAINYSTTSVLVQVMSEAFSQQADIRMTHIPYKGGGPAVVALLAGDVQVGFIDPAPSLPHIKSGKLRALAITARQRAAYLPEVPTLTEDVLPGFEEVAWFGLFARSGTPREIIVRISAEAVRTLRTQEVRDRLRGRGIAAGRSTRSLYGVGSCVAALVEAK